MRGRVRHVPRLQEATSGRPALPRVAAPPRLPHRLPPPPPAARVHAPPRGARGAGSSTGSAVPPTARTTEPRPRHPSPAIHLRGKRTPLSYRGCCCDAVAAAQRPHTPGREPAGSGQVAASLPSAARTPSESTPWLAPSLYLALVNRRASAPISAASRDAAAASAATPPPARVPGSGAETRPALPARPAWAVGYGNSGHQGRPVLQASRGWRVPPIQVLQPGKRRGHHRAVSRLRGNGVSRQPQRDQVRQRRERVDVGLRTNSI